MSYHIPSDKQLTDLIRMVLKKAHTIQSQSLLKKLIMDELKKKNKVYGVSPQRLRKLAIKSSFVSLEIHSRDGDPNKILKGCPVCDHNLKQVKNLTIWGGVVTIEFQCPNCGYWTGKRKRVPTRYVFHYTK
jgi:hypothetical protein